MSGVLFRLALRNLWRQKRRTFITCSALAVGIFLLIIMDSFIAGIVDLGARNIIDLQTSHLQIQPQAYFADPADLSLDDVFSKEPLLTEIRALPGVEGTTPRLIFSALLHNGVDEYAVMGTGIDLDTDGDVFTLGEYVEGRWLEPGTDQVLVGSRIANLMGLGIGDYALLITKTATGAFQALDLEVVGIVHSPHPEVNNTQVFMPLDVAQARLGLPDGANILSVRTTGEPQVVQRQIQELLGQQGLTSFQAYRWDEIAEGFLSMSQTSRTVNGILLGLVTFIAVVGVVNAILLSAIERTREIGMLKAMGMREGEILREFLLEAFGMGTIGSATGCILAILVNWYLVHYGLDPYAGAGDLGAGIPFQGIVYGVWHWHVILGALIVGIVISILAGIIPALRVSHRDPVWALRQ
ncbi:MAG: ABC transporter permease [Limnochordia bacterium]|jgi:putative ABC transport system permease protein